MNNNGIVRTKMAAAFLAAIAPEQIAGRKLGKVTRSVVHRVLTNNAKGVGVKFDPSRSKRKQQPAETAVMKEVA